MEGDELKEKGRTRREEDAVSSSSCFSCFLPSSETYVSQAERERNERRTSV